MTIRKLAAAAIVGGLAFAALPGYAVAATSDSEEFTVVKIGADSGTVFATGALNSAGSEDNNRLQVPPGSPFQVTFSFPEGQLFQTTTPSAPPQVEFDPVTCVTRVVLRTTTVVTGGTGALAGASGSGAGTANRTLIGGRDSDGNCLGAGSPPIFELTIVRAPGTLTLA